MSKAEASNAKEVKEVDHSLKNPDVLTKYKTAGEISCRVLAQVTALCQAGAKVIDLCIKGDELLIEETSKVYKGKNVIKGIGFPTSLSLNHVAAHFTPLPSDPEAESTIKSGDIVKISLGAQIDGFGAILGKPSTLLVILQLLILVRRYDSRR